jgi:Uma2 family endonuclease
MSAPGSLRFTYEDYARLPDDRRYEVIDGELCLTPAPTPYHQLVAKRLGFSLDAHAQTARLGEVFLAPCDLVLSKFDVLQPDVFFIAEDRRAIIGEQYISEAPDLVIEVLSPSTANRDRVVKAARYATFGVKEMWIADPEAKTIEIFTASEGGFRRETEYGAGEVLRSPLLPELEIPLSSIF